VHGLFTRQNVEAELQRQFQHLLQSGHALKVNTRDVGVVDDGDEAVHFHMLMGKEP